MARKQGIEERLEAIEREKAIADGVAHGIKVRCVTFWSGITIFFGAAGSWASDNIDALKAAFRAFWAVWGQKW